jgi:hypothetical protein
MRKLFAILGLLGSLATSAEAQPRESFDSIITSCEGAPLGAVTLLPPKLSEWATLSCTRFGHVVRAAKGWVWHNPRANAFVRVWAQPSGGNLSESGHAHHFKSIDFDQLTPEEAVAANEALAAALGAKAQPVAQAYRLTLVDAQGRVQTVNFVRTEANVRLGNFWGMVCEMPCKTPEVFMGIKPQ